MVEANKLNQKCTSCVYDILSYKNTPCVTCIYNSNVIHLTDNYIQK